MSAPLTHYCILLIPMKDFKQETCVVAGVPAVFLCVCLVCGCHNKMKLCSQALSDKAHLHSTITCMMLLNPSLNNVLYMLVSQCHVLYDSHFTFVTESLLTLT